MKKTTISFIIALFVSLCGCTTMDSLESDMDNFLKKVEIDRFAQDSDTQEADAGNTSAAKSQEKRIPKKADDGKHSLTIQVFPKDSTIRIMNIKTVYYDGVRLAPGEYDILVSRKGYKSYREWVNIEYDVILKVILNKEVEAYSAKALAPAKGLKTSEYDEIITEEVIKPPPVKTPTKKSTTKPASSPITKPESLALVEPESDQGTSPLEGAAIAAPEVLSGHYGSVSSLCFSPDGSLLASGSYDSIVIIWKMEDKSILHHLNHEDRVTAITFSADGTMLASAGSNKLIKLWDVTSGQLLQTLEGHTSRIHSTEFSPINDTLVSGANNELIIWDINSGKVKNLFVGDDKLYPRFGTIKAIAFNPNGKDSDGFEFAFSIYNGIGVFNPDNKKIVQIKDTATPHSVTYSPDGKYITWGARHHHSKSNYFPRMAFVESKKIDTSIIKDDEMAKADRVFFTAYTPDGGSLIMLSYNQAILYDFKTGSVVETFDGTSETSVTDAALNPAGDILAASSKDQIRIWKLK